MILLRLLFCFLALNTQNCTPAPEAPSESVNNENAAPPLSFSSPTPKTIELSPGHALPYNLDQPDRSVELAKELEEISGLSMEASGEYFWGVQDEKGKLYKIKLDNGKIEKEIKFHKSGDYEGVEAIGKEIYVVKSTGTLYQVKQPGESGQQTKKFNYFLSRENDVEGLTYDPRYHRLLLACKGLPATGESFDEIRQKKVVYSFDLKSKTLAPDPVYTIHLGKIREYLDAHPALRRYEKLKEFFSAGKENLTFNPSAIAIHPVNDNIYILSSVGKVLLVIDRSGKIVTIEKMDKKIHRQPEGITFSADGTLYIANEGKGGKAKIHQFRMR